MTAHRYNVCGWQSIILMTNAPEPLTSPRSQRFRLLCSSVQFTLTAQGFSRILPGTSELPTVMFSSTKGHTQVRGPSVLQHLLQVTLLNVNLCISQGFWVVPSCTTCVDRFVLHPCWATSKPKPNMTSYSSFPAVILLGICPPKTNPERTSPFTITLP